MSYDARKHSDDDLMQHLNGKLEKHKFSDLKRKLV